jgi:hypothetical protein
LSLSTHCRFSLVAGGTGNAFGLRSLSDAASGCFALFDVNWNPCVLHRDACILTVWAAEAAKARDKLLKAN